MTSTLLCSVLLFISLAATCIDLATSARILGFFPSPSKSHLIVHAAVADTLAQAGHDVTVFGSTNNVYPNAKYKYIQIGRETFENSVIAGMVNGSTPYYKQFATMLRSIGTSSNASITHPRVQRFLQEHGAGDIDLVIVGYIMNDFHFGLAAHFECPLIVSFMVQPIAQINSILGNPNEFAYVPTLMGKQIQPMDFVARVKNFFSILIEELGISEFNNRLQQKFYE